MNVGTDLFYLVDVFSDEPFKGNPLAVVVAERELDIDVMQSITRWLNLSETTFVLPPTDPQADYRVRIFTLERELPFAGHPTLGSCHAWICAGGVPHDAGMIVQQCGAGLVSLKQAKGRYAFRAPPLLRSGPVDADKAREVADFLRIELSEIVAMSWADNGPGWIAVLLRSADAVLALSPRNSHPSHLDVGVVGPHAAGSAVAFELRAFFTDHHGVMREDPVTGSLNASVGQWLFETNRASTHYLASQGTCLGRAGRIHVSRDDAGHVWVAGATVTRFSGRVTSLQ
jgi:PhzF family phenazine biosynthesis protein